MARPTEPTEVVPLPSVPLWVLLVIAASLGMIAMAGCVS